MAKKKARWTRVTKSKKSKILPSKMRDRMEAVLILMAACIRELKMDAEAKIWLNRDHTIDGWVRIRTMPSGISTSHVFVFIADHGCIRGIHREVWVSGAALFPLGKDEPETPPMRYRGMGVVQVFWQRTIGNNPIHNWATLKKACAAMQKKGHFKPVMITNHYHWNPQGEQPKRKGGSHGR